MLTDDTDPNVSWLYRAGGSSALAIGAGYLAIMALYIPMGAPPRGPEALLAYIAGSTTAWWAILWLSVLTDLLFLPVAMALYDLLKQFHRSAMILAATCFVLFVILDLALTWTNYAALITLSVQYVQAAGEPQKAVVIAAAQYPTLVVESNLLFVYNSLTLAIGILVAGLVMRNGIFSKTTAYLGVATGILGVVSIVGPVFVSALSLAIVAASLLTMIWLFFVGFRLYRLGGSTL